jgi:hypothetical protein
MSSANDDQGNDSHSNMSPSLIEAITSIVEAAMEGHGITLSAQKPSRWKTAHRADMALRQTWREAGWDRA